MGEFSSIEVPRCILGDVEDITSIQLHGFADASKSAYGASGREPLEPVLFAF